MEFYKQRLNNMLGFCIYLGTWVLILRLSPEQLGLPDYLCPEVTYRVSHEEWSWRPKINLPGVAIKYTRGNGLFFITAI